MDGVAGAETTFVENGERENSRPSPISRLFWIFEFLRIDLRSGGVTVMEVRNFSEGNNDELPSRADRSFLRWRPQDDSNPSQGGDLHFDWRPFSKGRTATRFEVPVNALGFAVVISVAGRDAAELLFVSLDATRLPLRTTCPMDFFL